MPDIADAAENTIQLELNAQLSAIRSRTGPQLAAIGCCHNCEADVGPGEEVGKFGHGQCGGGQVVAAAAGAAVVGGLGLDLVHFGTATRDHKGVDGELAGFAMEDEAEALGEQRLEHRGHLRERGLR